MKAVIFGATGAVGKELLKQCINNNYYKEIYVLGRKSIFKLPNQDKFQAIKIDFEKLDFDKNILKDADVFCSLGTTLKQAGSKEEQKKIDYDYCLSIAKSSSQICSSFNLVSAIGSDKNSKFFYSRLKGQLEEDVKKLAINNIRIYRPSLLLANRNGERKLEEFTMKLLPMFARLLRGSMTKYKPIKVELLAKTMVLNAINKNNKLYYDFNDFIKEL